MADEVATCGRVRHQSMGQKYSGGDNSTPVDPLVFDRAIRVRDYPTTTPASFMKQARSMTSELGGEFEPEDLLAIICRLMPGHNWAKYLQGYNDYALRTFIRLLVYDPGIGSACVTPFGPDVPARFAKAAGNPFDLNDFIGRLRTGEGLEDAPVPQRGRVPLVPEARAGAGRSPPSFDPMPSRRGDVWFDVVDSHTLARAEKSRTQDAVMAEYKATHGGKSPTLAEFTRLVAQYSRAATPSPDPDAELMQIAREGLMEAGNITPTREEVLEFARTMM